MAQTLHLSTLEGVQRAIADVEIESVAKYSTVKKDKYFGIADVDLSIFPIIRVRDTQGNTVPQIDFDGVPFIILGKKVYDCQHGHDHNKAKNDKKRVNEDGDHVFVKRRRRLQGTKKKGCPAKVRVRHIVKFTEFKLHSDDRAEMDKMRGNIKLKVANKEPVAIQHEYLVNMPLSEQHQNHFTGEAALLIQPIDTELKKYIETMVCQHDVTSTSQMRLLLEVYLKQTMYHGRPLPPMTSRRFWPSLKYIRNHMALCIMRQRNTNVDQAIVYFNVQSSEKESVT